MGETVRTRSPKFFYWSMDGKKVPSWECLFVQRGRGYFSVFVDDIKLAGKKQNIDPMWKIPNKQVDFNSMS